MTKWLFSPSAVVLMGGGCLGIYFAAMASFLLNSLMIIVPDE